MFEYGGEVMNNGLRIGTHTDGDDILRKQIEAFCRQEFPFIASQLESITPDAGAT